MKTHFMKLQKAPFESIKNKSKTVEMRLFDEKRQLLKKNDVIVFSKYDNSSGEIKTRIKGLRVFKNFKELYENYNKTQLGYKENEKACHKDMELYYPLEEQFRLNVLAIEIELI